MNREELLAKVRDLDDTAISIEPESKNIALDCWRRADSLLAGALSCDADDLEIAYLQSYVNYMIWARTGDDAIWLKSHDMAMLCAPVNPLAKFILICLYFEKGDWTRLQQVEFSEGENRRFASIGQAWRTAKIVEMKITASIKNEMNWTDVIVMAKNLVEAYESLENPEFLVPITIGNAVERSLMHSATTTLSIECLEVCKLVRRCSIVTQSLQMMEMRYPMLANVWAKHTDSLS